MSSLLFKQNKFSINVNILINLLTIRTTTALTRDTILKTYVKPIAQIHKYKSEIKAFQQRSMSSIRSFSDKITMEVTPSGVFQGNVDRFHGVTVESKSTYDLCENFSEMLQKSLDHWTKTNKRCIWFRIETAHADWVPALTKANFDFHHASRGLVVLFRWLPKNEKDNIPEYAHTMIGVGGVVINNNNEILVVSEKYASIAKSWKLPGGYVDANEDFIDAVLREVKEETGINCKFETLISLRHSHRANFNCSDLYIVMGLKPENLEYRLDEREIAQIQWMPVDEYLNHPKVHEINRFFVHKYLSHLRKGTRLVQTTTTHSAFNREVQLYHVKHSDEDFDEIKCLMPTKQNQDQ